MTDEKKGAVVRTMKDKSTALTDEQWVGVHYAVLETAVQSATRAVNQTMEKANTGLTVSLDIKMVDREFSAGSGPKGSVGEVGYEIHLKEAGVPRLLMRKTRHFAHVAALKEGKDQGKMEALRELFSDFISFAVVQDIMNRHGQKTDMQQGAGN